MLLGIQNIGPLDHRTPESFDHQAQMCGTPVQAPDPSFTETVLTGKAAIFTVIHGKMTDKISPEFWI
jgi:hypothetical protein